jgi:RNA polymerase sigma-70 factor (ECF subfamily)
MHASFHGDLVALLPRLRVHALALTHDRADAEDLAQGTAANALAAADSFEPGTDFAAWLHRMLRNRFVGGLRLANRRGRPETIGIDDAPIRALAVSGAHEDQLALKELGRALGRLPPDQHEALLMIVLHHMSYEEVAAATGSAVGTARSRVLRARRQLRDWLAGERGRRPATGSGAQRHAAAERVRPAGWAAGPTSRTGRR